MTTTPRCVPGRLSSPGARSHGGRIVSYVRGGHELPCLKSPCTHTVVTDSELGSARPSHVTSEVVTALKERQQEHTARESQS